MQPSAIFCDRCGIFNRPEARFCFSCGNALSTRANISSTGFLPLSHQLKQRYQIVKKLGQGGFGAVYLVEDALFKNARRAIKEMGQQNLTAQEKQEALAAFQQEAILLANLMHPHLPRIYDHFEEQGRWYLVMDYIRGETLTQRQEKTTNKQMPLSEVLPLSIQLATVLHYLHSQQPPIIFRDLKPDNIMVTPDEHLYLIDFGIARLFKPGQTKDTQNMGTPGYAPPEQHGSQQTNARADIYSLGATLHHLISGRNPADRPFIFPPLGLDKKQPALAALETLIGRMVEIYEQNRPATMMVVKQELQRIEQQLIKDVSTRPPPPKPKAPAATPPIITPLPDTLIVAKQSNAHYSTISEALQNAKAGNKILVRPGTYIEDITLNKEITLIGDGPRDTIILKADQQSAIRMKTEKATVRGFTIRGNNHAAVDIPRGQLLLEECDIIAAKSSGIYIYTKIANPTIRRCQIHDGEAIGIRITDNAQATIEQCEIFANKGAGLVISDDGHAQVHHSTFHHGKGVGIHVFSSAQGSIEDCEISANTPYNIHISKKGDPLFRRCYIHDANCGIHVSEEGQGTIEECRLTAHKKTWDILPGCQLKQLKNRVEEIPVPILSPKPPKKPVAPTVPTAPTQPKILIVSKQAGGHYNTINEAIQNAKAGCNILVRPGTYTENIMLDKEITLVSDGPGTQIIGSSTKHPTIRMRTEKAVVRGFIVRGNNHAAVDITQGQLLLEECDLSSNNAICVYIRTATANPILRGCRIHDCKAIGIHIIENARASIEQCEIFANNGAGISISDGGKPVVRYCQIHHGYAAGIYVFDNGLGIVEDCEIFANTTYNIGITSKGNPLIRRCHIRDADCGVSVTVQGQGTIEECRLTGHQKNWDIHPGCQLKQQGNIVERDSLIPQFIKRFLS